MIAEPKPKFGAEGGTRTLRTWLLVPVRIPIPPQPQNLEHPFTHPIEMSQTQKRCETDDEEAENQNTNIDDWNK